MGYMKSRHARSKYKTRSQARKREWTDENPRPPDATEDNLIADCGMRDIWGLCICKRCGKLWSRDVSSVGNQWNITIAALERPCVGKNPAYRPARYNHNPNKLSNTRIFTRDPLEGDTWVGLFQNFEMLLILSNPLKIIELVSCRMKRLSRRKSTYAIK